MNPLEGNPLRRREDLRRAVRDLFDPLVPYFSPGNARVKPGATGARFPDSAAQLEGFARPLWGLAPLAAGGGEFVHWDRYRGGLAHGTDPDHPEYWGSMPERTQMAVEMAPIGFALATAPDRLWTPLDAETRERAAAWLSQINDVAFDDGNWRFFRVLTNLGLHAVGAPHDADRLREDLDVLEGNYLGDGWYADGSGGHCDYYSAWEFQVDSLVYAALAGEEDPERTARFRQRAAAFADDYAHWFADDGGALPYGRSLTYRFAQGAYWGALAFADVRPEGFSWGALKGAWLRHLRWWCDRPIFTDGGVLSLGYGYPTLKTTEVYNSPSSPYWSMKFFLPLALPASHPFWTAEEEPLPERDAIRTIPQANMIVARDRDADHVVALTPGHGHLGYGAKYEKFAYSTKFGFGVAGGTRGLAGSAPDSALAFTTDGEHYRTREDVRETRVGGEVPRTSNDRTQSGDVGVAYSRWRPYPDVAVETWLAPATPWHARVHRVRTERPLKSVEGGFAFPAGDPAGFPPAERREDETETRDGVARVGSRAGLSGLVDAVSETGEPTDGGRETGAARTGDLVFPEPNTNLLHPRATVPVLRGEHGPGECVLATAVLGTTPATREAWDEPPRVRIDADGARIEEPGGETAEIAFDEYG